MNKFESKYKLVNLIVISLLFCCLNTACISVKPIYYDDDKKIAEKHVEKFHQLFNDEKYDEIYNLYTPKIQNAQSKEQFAAALQKLRAEAGRIKNSKIIKTDVKPLASSRLVHMFYETEFEKSKLFEEFDCLVEGENAVFDFYGQPKEIPNNQTK
jgi:hypothetical protein